jgi:hypothetical protein
MWLSYLAMIGSEARSRGLVSIAMVVMADYQGPELGQLWQTACKRVALMR